MRVIILTIIILLLYGNLWAELPAPPILRDLPVQAQQYFKILYDNHNKFEVVTTDPNGSRRGNYGDMVIYKDIVGGTWFICVCISTPNGTVWKEVQIS